MRVSGESVLRPQGVSRCCRTRATTEGHLPGSRGNKEEKRPESGWAAGHRQDGRYRNITEIPFLLYPEGLLKGLAEPGNIQEKDNAPSPKSGPAHRRSRRRCTRGHYFHGVPPAGSHRFSRHVASIQVRFEPSWPAWSRPRSFIKNIHHRSRHEVSDHFFHHRPELCFDRFYLTGVPEHLPERPSKTRGFIDVL